VCVYLCVYVRRLTESVAACCGDLNLYFILCESSYLNRVQVQHTAPRCNTPQHTATHCNTLQHTATHCNSMQHSATHYYSLQHTAAHRNTPQHTATHAVLQLCCVALSRTSHHTYMSQVTHIRHVSRHTQFTVGTTLQHTAAHCNTLQHTPTHSNTLTSHSIHSWVFSVHMLSRLLHTVSIPFFPRLKESVAGSCSKWHLYGVFCESSYCKTDVQNRPLHCLKWTNDVCVCECVCVFI